MIGSMPTTAPFLLTGTRLMLASFHDGYAFVEVTDNGYRPIILNKTGIIGYWTVAEAIEAAHKVGLSVDQKGRVSRSAAEA